MNTGIQTAIAAWTLLSVLNESETPRVGFRHLEDPVEEVNYKLLPGYNQATTGQNMKIELDEQVEGRFVWHLTLPQGVKMIQDVVSKENKHVWVIQATQVGRYKVIADYIDKKHLSRIRKRVLFEIEVLPCPCGTYQEHKKNTTK